LQPAAPYDRITHEPPSAAGYCTRELVHFVRRTSGTATGTHPGTPRGTSVDY